MNRHDWTLSAERGYSCRMKLVQRVCLVVELVLVLPMVALPAELAERIKYPTERTEFAQRSFGDVSFVMGAGQAMRWLEMYSDGNLIGAFRDFDAAEVHASPDGKYFLAISNARNSALAFAVLDRNGQIVLSSPHDMGLPYCNQGDASSRYWINSAKPEARFSVQKNPKPSGPDAVDVAVRDCDGTDISLARFAHITEPATGPFARPNVNCDAMQGAAVKVETPVEEKRDTATETSNRSRNFIGNTIANLRCLDPSFGGRTLTLIDGRRSTSAPAAPVSNQPSTAK